MSAQGAGIDVSHIANGTKVPPMRKLLQQACLRVTTLECCYILPPP